MRSSSASRVPSARLALSGIILSKMDGDARGGAALSIRQVHGAARSSSWAPARRQAHSRCSHPERIVSRLLGMGDMLTLIEKVEEQIDEKQALATAGAYAGRTSSAWKTSASNCGRCASSVRCSRSLTCCRTSDRSSRCRVWTSTPKQLVAHRGNHQLHDRSRSGATRTSPQRQPATAHRQRERHNGAAGQSVAQAVQASA